jgi:hypothetical protein
MDLRVAVLTGTPDDARTLSSSQQRTGSRLSVSVECAVMAYRQVVALLTQIGTRPDEELVVVGTMRLMTVETTLADGRVFPEERSPLFGVTRVANLVHGIEVQKSAGRLAVRAVAVDAGHLSFGQRHVRTPAKLGALLLVTLVAGF